MTPRQLFLLAPHLRLWNAQIERAKAAYDLAPTSVGSPWCAAHGCMRRATARGLCKTHYNTEYQQWRRRKPAP